MGIEVGTALLASAIIGAGATGYAGYKQSQAQKEAAKKAEESSRMQAQLAQEQAPEQASNISSSDVIKKDEGVKGLRSTLLANNKKYSAPDAGDKTLLGQ